MMARDFRCPPGHKHGETSTCYDQHGCGCDDCLTTRREYQYWRNHLRSAGKWDRAWSIDATGTRRRMQALAFMGWPTTVLCDLLGTTQAQTHKLLRNERVSIPTAERVRAVYDQVWNVEPPGGARVYTMNRARSLGWVGPLAWDDDTIDDPDAIPEVDPEVGDDRLDAAIVDAAVAGEQPKMSPLERAEAIRRLNALNWSAARIARWIDCSPKTIDRVRKRLELPVPDNNTIREAA